MWNSPWGPGRPGWHIECSAIIENTMERFQHSHKIHFHAGGVDLKFPHHTNEIAQAEAYHASLRKDQTVCEENMEWIPHWVHTGHLHIEGRKMSKSLKNFITIRELLSEENSDDSAVMTKASILESPADDFRTWCLGLSGSYKSPATYSKSRIAEAKQVRLKWVQFLMEGEEWIQTSSKSGDTSSLSWDQEDLALFQEACKMEQICQQALIGCVGNSRSGFDFDGPSYMDAMVTLAEHGQAYMSSSERKKSPVEPMYTALQKLRSCLDKIGFSDATVRIGLEAASNHSKAPDSVAFDRAIVDELANFRKSVRDMALKNIKEDHCAKELLDFCDKLRDETLPPLGIEIKDTQSTQDASWRLCIPQNRKQNSVNEVARQNIRPKSISTVEELFQVGQYSGQFSSFGPDGVPTHDKDGLEISKRLRKKLIKKKNAFLEKERN